MIQVQQRPGLRKMFLWYKKNSAKVPWSKPIMGRLMTCNASWTPFTPP